MIVTSLLIFLPSAHCMLVGCICVGSKEMHQAFKHRPAGEAVSGGQHSFLREKNIFDMVYEPRVLLPPRPHSVFITCVLVCRGSQQGRKVGTS